MSKYASVITEIYEETADNSTDGYIPVNRQIRKDQFLISYPADRDPYHWVYHGFEGTGCGPELNLIIVQITEVSSDFFTFHTQNYTHFKNPPWCKSGPK
jgi:hypothetical protein